MQRGWPADQVQVVGFVHRQSFMDVTVRVDIRSHGAVQRQAKERENKLVRHVIKHQNDALKLVDWVESL